MKVNWRSVLHKVNLMQAALCGCMLWWYGIESSSDEHWLLAAVGLVGMQALALELLVCLEDKELQRLQFILRVNSAYGKIKGDS